MKRLLVIMLLMLPLICLAQTAENIRLNPNYIWGQGSSDTEAITELINKLSATDILQVSNKAAIWKTYRQDLIRVSKHISNESGNIIRYIKWDNIDNIFSGRCTKIEELCAHAKSEISRGNSSVARTYLEWAETYCKSIPSSSRYSNMISSLKSQVGKGPMATIDMRNIENDVKNINTALGVKFAENPKITTKPTMPKPTVEKSAKERIFLNPKLSGIKASKMLVEDNATPKLAFSAPTEVAITEDVTTSKRLFVIPRATISKSIGVGGFAGVMLGKIGPWIAYDTDFNSTHSSYTCQADGTTSFGHIWTNGKQKYHGTDISAGVLYDFTTSLKLYAGLGYGTSTCYWQDTSESWAEVEDKSIKGMAAEVGGIYNISHLSILGSVSAISLKTPAIHLGIGLNF